MPHPTPIDITNMPELVRIAEEVEATRTPRELKKDNTTVAVIAPVAPIRKARKRREKTTVDLKAFKAAAGSWKDVDIEKFKADMYESRKLSTRPPVKL
jgi:cell envelope opacity-associated protein A